MRTPIGFKQTVSEAAVIETRAMTPDEYGRMEALLELAEIIDKQMRLQADSMAGNREFSSFGGKVITEKLNKFYTKYYEKL
ncbi:MAG: hypothetical protein H3C36_02300 [Chitinophagaceae bacterium]|nr:hypothetical protein [Chitinophagaceae bacterium]